MTKGEAASTNRRILGDGESKDWKLGSQSPLGQPPKCPECWSQRVWRDGLRYTTHGDVQRWLCRSCGYRFSETQVKVNIGSQVLESSKSNNDLAHDVISSLDSVFKESVDDCSLLRSKDVASHGRTVVGQRLNSFRDYNSTRRVCVSNREMKNLVKVETRQKQAAGATTQANIKGKIVEYAWTLMKEGYKENTIITRTVILKILAKRGANLWDPESVKEAIARQSWSEARKMNAVYAYNQFLKLIGGTWKPPAYTPTRKIPFIPTEQEIDALIAGCGKKIATKLQLIKETAMRSGEARKLKWTDIDAVNRTIRVNAPEKHSNPRIFKASQKLISMLTSLSKTSLRVFGDTARMTDNKNYYCQRKRLARKLDNPRLLQIGFHTLRHWKATKLYHQTKDILYVKEFLGHKDINSTLMYVQIATVVFGASLNDEFLCKVARTPDEVSELIEAGFDYVTDFEGTKFFRKRK